MFDNKFIMLTLSSKFTHYNLIEFFEISKSQMSKLKRERRSCSFKVIYILKQYSEFEFKK